MSPNRPSSDLKQPSTFVLARPCDHEKFPSAAAR
jgi:hypothetical protein